MANRGFADARLATQQVIANQICAARLEVVLQHAHQRFVAEDLGEGLGAKSGQKGKSVASTFASIVSGVGPVRGERPVDHG